MDPVTRHRGCTQPTLSYGNVPCACHYSPKHGLKLCRAHRPPAWSDRHAAAAPPPERLGDLTRRNWALITLAASLAAPLLWAAIVLWTGQP